MSKPEQALQYNIYGLFQFNDKKNKQNKYAIEYKTVHHIQKEERFMNVPLEHIYQP